MQPLWEFVNQQEEYQLLLFDLDDYIIEATEDLVEIHEGEGEESDGEA